MPQVLCEHASLLSIDFRLHSNGCGSAPFSCDAKLQQHRFFHASDCLAFFTPQYITAPVTVRQDFTPHNIFSPASALQPGLLALHDIVSASCSLVVCNGYTSSHVILATADNVEGLWAHTLMFLFEQVLNPSSPNRKVGGMSPLRLQRNMPIVGAFCHRRAASAFLVGLITQSRHHDADVLQVISQWSAGWKIDHFASLPMCSTQRQVSMTLCWSVTHSQVLACEVLPPLRVFVEYPPNTSPHQPHNAYSHIRVFLVRPTTSGLSGQTILPLSNHHKPSSDDRGRRETYCFDNLVVEGEGEHLLVVELCAHQQFAPFVPNAVCYVAPFLVGRRNLPSSVSREGSPPDAPTSFSSLAPYTSPWIARLASRRSPSPTVTPQQ